MAFSLSAQTNTPNASEIDKADSVQGHPKQVFVSVQQQPQFPGGTAAFFHYIAKSIQYPKNDFKNGIQGKVVVAFMVDYDGSLTHITIVNSVSPDIDAEAIRLIRESPKWAPGIQNGRPARATYTVPITFKIPN